MFPDGSAGGHGAAPMRVVGWLEPGQSVPHLYLWFAAIAPNSVKLGGKGENFK
ncbi:hypothetical protein [Oxynema aestuarii]|uniref:Uncharacterized protein n=1 Tax=Oxynema aestuarii AP17 TaxID=2064643 RepID=A0A6H1U1K5_9CYAN|nr:hypothetical protein [Oxynema aestuarii]QIZ71499.1 hypothetical protein HCG48_13680 [Oxynema aestuarii AP17]